jgi:hypothetical protein
MDPNRRRTAAHRADEGSTAEIAPKVANAPEETDPQATEVPAEPVGPAGEPPSAAASEAAMTEQFEQLAAKKGVFLDRGQFAKVGSRLYTGLKIGGQLLLMYQISQIRSFRDVADFAEGLAFTEATSALAEAISGSAGIGFVVPMLLGMESDQGPGVRERQIASTFVLNNFTPEEIARDGDTLRKQARILIFGTKPFSFREPPGPSPGMYGGDGLGSYASPSPPGD